MKNKYPFLVALLVFTSASSLVSCGNETSIPDAIKGEDTIINNLKGTPDKNNAKDVILNVLGKLNDAKFYEKKSTTKTYANKGFINYVQNSGSISIKNSDEYYLDSTSNSDFVNMEHEAFYKNGFVAYRDSKGEIRNAKIADYSTVYGVTPNKLLSGQIFNQDTILLAKLDSTENDLYNYTIILDKELANASLVYQMKKFGNLTNYPVFTDNTEFKLTIKSDYTPTSYSYSASYNISYPILGDLTCKEETTAEFTKFNESVEIPDSVSFNKALNMEPTKVDDNENIIENEDLKAVVEALVNSDVKNGIAFSGAFKIDNYQLPIKINLKADIDKLLSSNTDNLKSAIDATLAIKGMNGDLKVTYHDYKLYVEAFNKSYAFSLPRKEDTNDFDYKDLENVFEVSKDANINNRYNISLTDEYVSLIREKLATIGLIKSNEGDFDLSFGLDINNDKIGSVDFSATINQKVIEGDLLFGEETYVLPNIEDFETKINIKANTAITLQESLGEILNGEINFTYDCEETNVMKAITLDAKFQIGEKILNSLKSIAGMTDQIPDLINAFYNAKYCNLIIKDGNLYIIATNDNDDVLLFKKQSLIKEEAEQEKVDLSILDELIKKLPNIIDILYGKDGLTIKLNDAEISKINSSFKEIYEKIAMKIGVTGGNTLVNTFGLYRRISSAALHIPTFDLDNFEASLEVNGYDMAQKDVYNEKVSYTTSNLLNITFKKEEYDENYKFNWDLETIEENSNLAQKYIDEIDDLKNSLALTGEYSDLLDDFSSRYNGLEDEVKNLIYNANVSKGNSSEFVTDNLKNQIENKKKTIENFVKNCKNERYSLNSLNNTYNSFTDAELNYLESEYKETLDLYISKRLAAEAKTVETIKDNLSKLESKDVATMNSDEIYNYLNSLVNIDKSIKNCLPESTKDLDLAMFDEELNKTIEQYVYVYSSLAVEKVNEMISFETKCDMSIDEMCNYYASLNNFNSKYFTAFNNSTIGGVFKSAYPEFESKMYQVDLYLKYNGHGFLAGVVKVLEKEIDDILLNKYDTSVLEPKISSIKKLIDKSKVNTSNISNYSDILPIIEVLENKNIKEKLVEYTNAINELLSSGSEDDIADFFDWGWGDYQYDDILKFYKSITYLQIISNETEYKELGEALAKILEQKPDDDFDW